MITLSIDLKQLDKSRFKPFTRRNGKEALFCELVLIPTPDGKYGDYMVKQGISKEERSAGTEMPIIGNGKNVGKARPSNTTPKSDNPSGDEPRQGDEIPF